MPSINKIRYFGTDYDILGEEMPNKANIDGSYDNMTVGNAKQLVATVGITDKVPYNFRTSGGSADIGDREVDKIVGGTVVWNQLAPVLSSEKWAGNSQFGTCVFNNNKATYTITQKSGSQSIYISNVKGGIPLIKDHKYVVEFDATISQSTSSLSVNVMDTQWVSCPSVQANTKQHCAKVFNSANATGGNAYFGIYPSTGAGVDVGGTFVLENVIITDLTQLFGTTIADYIYGLETANAGAGVAWFKKLFPKPYYEYDAGTLKSVEGVSAHKTVGFNAWDEQWEVGAYSSVDGNKASVSDRIRSKNFIPVFPSTTYYHNKGLQIYFYDADHNYVSWQNLSNVGTFNTPSNAHYMTFNGLANSGTTYNHDICINLSWDGEKNGTYEPYVEHTYPLDADVVLRGIPKLDSNNQLYYDGDTYESDGTVTRRYGVVDLGTLTWSTTSAGYFYSTSINNLAKKGNAQIGYTHIRCVLYVAQNVASLNSLADKSMSIDSGGNIQIHDSAYSDSNAFKTAMSGVMLVYELTTPTTESADPFTNPQIVDDFGTEEYVDAGVTASTPTRDVAIPVGHETVYQANLRAKLEMAPNSPDGDGDYIVRQTNGENEYVLLEEELPSAPSSDGTYVLKATVASGTVTLTWVEET